MKTNIMKKLSLFVAALAFCAVLTAKPVDAAVPAPTDLAQSQASTTSVKVSWTKSLYVKYYEVQVSETGKENTYVSDTSYATDSDTIYGLSTGKTYYVRVRACNPELSNWVTIKVDTAPANITSLKQTYAKAKSVRVTWSKTAGATGYMVYKARPTDTNWTPVKSTTSNTCSITLPKDSKYEIAVLPYRNAANSKVKVPATSSPKYITCVTTPSAPKGLTIYTRSNSSKKTGFEWIPTSIYDNTDGYQLQVYYIKNGVAKKLTTKKTTSFFADYASVESTKLFNHAFKYRVRSYVKINNKTYYSAWSSFKTYVPGAIVNSITTKRYGATSGTLKWSKVNGAKSYTVYWKAAKDDNWKKVATTTKTYANVKYSSSATYNYYYVKANKVRIGTKKTQVANSSGLSKTYDTYRVW